MGEQETRTALLEERVQKLQEQQARFESHFDSESRAREHLKDRAALIEKTLARIEDRMALDREEKEKDKWTFQKIMQILSNLVAIGALLVMLFKDKI